MTTPTNDSVSTLGLGAGKTATALDDNKQTFALKVQHNEDIRRCAIPELAWQPLIKKVAELFKLQENSIVLKYKDEEGDLVTIASAEELLDAQRLAIQQSTLLRLCAFTDDNAAKKQIDSPASNAVPLALKDPFAELSPSELKSQRRLLKEQRKLLKEGKKEAKILKNEQKELRREHKRAFKEGKKETKQHSKADDAAAFDPSKGSWREQRLALRQQRLALRQEKLQRWMGGDAAPGAPAAAASAGQPALDGKKRWREMTREERIELRMARLARGRDAEGGNCRGKTRLVARFVKHVTVPDGAEVAPRQAFVKIWRLRNEGEESWPADCKLVFISRKNGDQLGAADSVVVPGIVQPGQEIDISVDMVAPDQPGRYVGFWRLCTAEERKFGQRIWVKIDVVCSSSSSEDEAGAVPTAPPKDSLPASPYDTLEQEVAESFFEISKDEDDKRKKHQPKLRKQRKPAAVAAAPTSGGGKPTIAELLKQLKELGFSEDIGRNIALLKKHDGNIDKVIAELLA